MAGLDTEMVGSWLETCPILRRVTYLSVRDSVMGGNVEFVEFIAGQPVTATGSFSSTGGWTMEPMVIQLTTAIPLITPTITPWKKKWSKKSTSWTLAKVMTFLSKEMKWKDNYFLTRLYNVMWIIWWEIKYYFDKVRTVFHYHHRTTVSMLAYLAVCRSC